MSVLAVSDVKYAYQSRYRVVNVLNDVSCSFEMGKFYAIVGKSGSGKTTLLYQRIRARAEAGEKSILLVPEQFTSSTEARIHR